MKVGPDRLHEGFGFFFLPGIFGSFHGIVGITIGRTGTRRIVFILVFTGRFRHDLVLVSHTSKFGSNPPVDPVTTNGRTKGSSSVVSCVNVDYECLSVPIILDLFPMDRR